MEPPPLVPFCGTANVEIPFYTTPMVAASVFTASRVERASRSSRVTITTSPGARRSSNRRSCVPVR